MDLKATDNVEAVELVCPEAGENRELQPALAKRRPETGRESAVVKPPQGPGDTLLGTEGNSMAETVADRVLEETRRFRAALPELLKEHPGKWVVFKDGAVHSIHDTEEEAYGAGLTAFGRDGGHVVAPVIQENAAPVTAGVLFNVFA